ncbi:hypothetical protein PtB15_6B439 [Puccinia triticina]|nr:hypothetical protein PtB15_6B439 [Puccinia triticina]
MQQPNPSSQHPHPHHPHSTTTPQAGTSSTANRQSQPNPKALYFPVIDQGHLPAAPISGSQDLLSLFNVSSMYDWFVKPYLKPLDQPNKLINSTLGTNNLTNHHISNANADLKGKGKPDNDLAGLSPAQLENLGQKRIKMDRSYGHYVADVGGRNSIKKDHQLESWISDPNFQEINIPNFLKPLSSEVLSQAFTFQPGMLPGFESSLWVAEEGGPKKRRKKRKQGEMLAGSNPPQATTAHPHQHLSPTQPLATTTTASGTPSQEDDYRKKKRVKIGNTAAGKTSGSGSSGPNHQVALQS